MIGVNSDMLIRLEDKQKYIDDIKPERGCLSSVVFDSPDGLWSMSGRYYPDPGGSYIHPIMRLLNVIGGSRPGTVYVTYHTCPTCVAILRTYPQFEKVIVRSYYAE